MTSPAAIRQALDQLGLLNDCAAMVEGNNRYSKLIIALHKKQTHHNEMVDRCTELIRIFEAVDPLIPILKKKAKQ